jgi:tyrosine-specific transport protein
MTHKTGINRVFGAILLICGTAVGAAMLVLPVATGRAGFIPSFGTMLFCWLYLTYAAFCILEVNLAVDSKGSLISMASQTLGKSGKIIGWVAYLFLLYALNTAYIASSTQLVQSTIERITGYSFAHIICVVPLLIIFGLLLRQGIKVIDEINRVLMAGLAISFVLLLGLSFQHVKLEYLEAYNLKYVLPSLSTVVTAFGFHIIIPSLVHYLHGNVRQLRIAIWVGSSIPFAAYTLWQIATLGIVPLSGSWSVETAYERGLSGAELLAALTHHPSISTIAMAFAFFAIITSFLGVSLSLFDFLADGLKVENRSKGKWKLFFFTFVPPLYFALSVPRAFFSALEFAGAYGVVTLLALLPGLMVWRKRYVLHIPSAYKVAGGKAGLVVFIAISLIIIVCETLLKTGVIK